MVGAATLLERLAHERVLVLGASGWFGSTLRSAIRRHPNALYVASQKRTPFSEFDLELIEEFAPTFVFGFAFLTRDKLRQISESEFVAVNRRLTQNFLSSAKLASVRGAITISSGAAITMPDTLYGKLKLEEEAEARAIAVQDKRAVVIGRAFSVSGPWVRHPRNYAFSDLILQAQTGRMRVTSDRLTYRRYVDVKDFIAVLTHFALTGNSLTVESGGEIVEMAALAQRIRSHVRPSATLEREEILAPPSEYLSTDGSWERALKFSQLQALTLDEQIRKTAQGLALRERGSLLF